MIIAWANLFGALFSSTPANLDKPETLRICPPAERCSHQMIVDDPACLGDAVHQAVVKAAFQKEDPTAPVYLNLDGKPQEQEAIERVHTKEDLEACL